MEAELKEKREKGKGTDCPVFVKVVVRRALKKQPISLIKIDNQRLGESTF